MNLYFWMRDERTGQSTPGTPSHVAYLEASTFLLGHWFETNKEDIFGSRSIWIKVAKMREPNSNLDVRIMSVRRVRHLSASHFINLWNWSSTVYKLLYVPTGTEPAGDFAIDIYPDDSNPYELYLQKAKKFDFSARHMHLYERFKSAAVLLGKPLVILQDPDDIVDIEHLLKAFHSVEPFERT